MEHLCVFLLIGFPPSQLSFSILSYSSIIIIIIIIIIIVIIIVIITSSSSSSSSITVTFSYHWRK